MTKFQSKLQVIFFITCIAYSELLGESQIDKLLQNGNLNKLKTLIDNTKIIDNENQLPSSPKENDLIIIDNEYEVKSLFEYHDNQWNDKVNKTIAKLLNNDTGTTYGNLFNYKVNSKDFNPYESDDFKYNTQEESSKVHIVFINSINKQNNINKKVTSYLQENMIGVNQIINIQITKTDKPNCQIILIYKN